MESYLADIESLEKTKMVSVIHITKAKDLFFKTRIVEIVRLPLQNIFRISIFLWTHV